LDLALAASGARDSEGAGALGLGLAVAATGVAAEPAEGTVALGLSFAVSSTGIAEIIAAPAVAVGSWHGLLAVVQEAREMQREDDARLANPVECPNDGEPVLTGPHGERYCPYDHWRA
jgi:hypothetical protein